MSLVRPSIPVCISLIAFWLTGTGVMAADINLGRHTYQQHCAMCHGSDGSPSMAGAADFKRGEGLMQSDKSLLDRIGSGNRACPAYLGILDKQEILDVIAYIRTLY